MSPGPVLDYASERVQQQSSWSWDDDIARVIIAASKFLGLQLGSGRILGIATSHLTIHMTFMSDVSMHCKPILVQSTVQ